MVGRRKTSKIVIIVVLVYAVVRLCLLVPRPSTSRPTSNETIKNPFLTRGHVIMELLVESERGYQNYLTQRKRLFERNPLREDLAYYPWWYLRPAFSCPYSVQRVGEVLDGGKWVCGMEVYEATLSTGESCIVYSFGSSRTSMFEQEILNRTNCELYAYDIGLDIEGPQTEKQRANYFKMALVGDVVSEVEGVEGATLGQLMRKNGHSAIDILKVDIEFSEYPALHQIMDEFENLPFSQLQIEMHAYVAHYPRLLDLWERLEEKGLRAFSQEINPYDLQANGVSACYEYSFLNIVKPSRLIPERVASSSRHHPNKQISNHPARLSKT